MIFISAALLLTNSTRNRLYEQTRSGQARLTVTSVSEAFYRALEMQQVSDYNLNKWANDESEFTFASLEGYDIPGLGTDTKNTTTVKFSKGKGADAGKIFARFKTTIGDESECVDIVFSLKPKEDDEYKYFSNQLDVAGTNNDVNLAMMNMGLTAGTNDDNTIVIRGRGKKYNIDRGSNNYNSTIIFVGQTSSTSIDVTFNDGTYGKDIVFVGDYATMNWDKQTTIEGNIYFINKKSENNTAVFSNASSISTSGNWGTDPTWVFVNRKLTGTNNVRDYFNSKKFLLLSGTKDSLKWASSNVSSPIVDKYNKIPTDSWATNAIKDAKAYMKGDYIGTDFPKSDKAFQDLKISPNPLSGKAYDEQIENNGDALKLVFNGSIGDFLASYAYSASNTTVLPSGNYYIHDGGTGWTTPNGGKKSSADGCKYVFMSGSNSYRIYLGSSYDLSNVCFVLLNGKKNCCNFILESGVNIKYGNGDGNGFSDGFSMGFVSVSSKAYSSASSMYEAIKNKTVKPNEDTYKDAGTKGTIPYINIYGVGNNKITVGNTSHGGVVIEAFVGLFDASYPGKSKIEVYNQPEYLFGRFMVSDWYIHTDSNNNKLYYCPDPNKVKDDDNLGEANSEFQLIDIIYYGNNK